MIYNSFADKKLSALGMGCMRFPVKENNSQIDMEKTREMIAYAMEQGINYYDTAWGYHDGNSEPVIGEILSEYPRESFYLATKFPGYDLENMDKVEEIFEKQIERCRVDYFDFYLFHCLTENNIDAYLDPKFGIYDYLVKQKSLGRIHHLGFSVHCSHETMKRFLDAYGKDIEFCQIQLNWFDWDYQDAKTKVEICKSYGIPVWVMEPVRGGSLAKLDDFYMQKLESLKPSVTPAEWCFRFIQSIPQVTMTLSGMSNFEQLKENIATYKESKPLNEKEMDTLLNVGRAMASKKVLPCTSCRYCTTHCPMDLDIPKLIEVYNEFIYSGNVSKEFEAIEENKLPSACIGCKACEGVCPQTIEISKMMADFAQKV